MKNATDKPLCFVVQGFGSKTDYTDGRVLDLDASYDVIKAAVERAGLRCQRADEIVHAGTIDIPMYEQLLNADLVIADLSTNNLNAAFELGVRYALRPRATIVVAESKFKSPFDVNHIVIRRYEHLGPDVGAKEARRFERDLAACIKVVMADTRTDSPVYTMLPLLQPPRGVSAPVAPTPVEAPGNPTSVGSGTRPARAPKPPPTARDWLDRAQRAMAVEDYGAAVKAWDEVRRFSPSDTHATQQLALATYRHRRPSVAKSLEAARDLLATLSPATTNDAATLTLWAAIHQRRWDRAHDPADLAEALSAFERSHVLKVDHYNAAHLAYLLQVRATQHLKSKRHDDALADWVNAQRLWRDAQTLAEPAAARADASISARYWAAATMWQASIALADGAAERRWQRRTQAMTEVSPRKQAAASSQATRLRELTNELVARLGPVHPAADTA
ncbi:tetratricopeptide repeat-containing protein [Ideonella sp. DXS29W]|uniref:Tetratricopeptide repeat-containing protein n=1 Tax=Ideonella lacteola TaxID=2984193 RepID=A0ABU9BKS8_9BURK